MFGGWRWYANLASALLVLWMAEWWTLLHVRYEVYETYQTWVLGFLGVPVILGLSPTPVGAVTYTGSDQGVIITLTDTIRTDTIRTRFLAGPCTISP